VYIIAPHEVVETTPRDTVHESLDFVVCQDNYLQL